MSRVITFSTNYPSYHSRRGEPTFFAEKIYAGLMKLGLAHPEKYPSAYISYPEWQKYGFKFTTIRAGNRWEVRDKFSPRIWSAKPYCSKQIIIADDIEIKKVWNFEMDINGIYSINGKYIDLETKPLLAKNDGLTEDDMFSWFMPNYNKPKPFIGQVICWNGDIEY